VTLEGWLENGSGKFGEHVRVALDRAAREMTNLGATSHSVFFDGGTGAVKISCCVDVEREEDAVPPASSMIRAALHHGRIGTPEWPGVNAPDWMIEFAPVPQVELV